MARYATSTHLWVVHPEKGATISLPSIWIPRTLSLVHDCAVKARTISELLYTVEVFFHILHCISFLIISSSKDGITPPMHVVNQLYIIVLKCLVAINTKSSSRRQSPGIQRRELRSPGIDSQSGGQVGQPYLTYRLARLYRLVESIPNRFLRIDSWAP